MLQTEPVSTISLRYDTMNLAW